MSFSSSKGRRSSETGAGGPAKVKAACEECRTRKTKAESQRQCDGVRPICGRCQSKNRTCVYETEPDEFRITALKRRYTELAQAASNNEALIRLLREKGHDDAVNILDRLRSGDSIDSILSGGVQHETEAEKNLMAAVEEARSSDMMEGSEPTSATSSAAEDGSMSRFSSSRGAVNKQSIAFLMGEEEPDPSSSGPASSPEELPQPVAAVRDSLVEKQKQTERPERQLEKRSRTEEPHRPSIRGPALSLPAVQSSVLGSSVEPLTRKPQSQDRAWMKELGSVKAADWEVYYTDDETFLDTLKCYFTWENPSLGFVNEAAFWNGLVTGECDFCNRPLVHSIMAFGSKIYSMFNPTRAASSTHFALIEVTKMWDWDADATVPANVSTGLLLHAVLTSNGQEKDGSPYLAGAMNLATQSALFSRERMAQAYPHSNMKLSKERAAWAWNMFAYHGYYTLTFNESLMMSGPPPIDAPTVDPTEDSREWTPFPVQGAARPHLSSSLWLARARLWHTGSHIQPLHNELEQSTGSEEHWNRAMIIYGELSHWRTGLNSRLNTLHGAAPHVFTLHSEYHRCMIDLLRPFVKSQNPHVNDDIAQRAQSLTDESYVQLRLLLHQFDMEFPGMPIPLKMLINPLLYVVTETLPSLTRKEEVPDEVFYFDLCVKLMCRMQDAYPLMRFLILDIQQIADRQGVVLPQASRDIVEVLQKNRSASQPLLTTYPGHEPEAAAVEGSHLQRLIGKTQGLTLGRHEEKSQESEERAG